METLRDIIAALGDSKYAFDLDTPIRVSIYGVTQKSIVKVDKITESGVNKIILYLEEFDQTDKDEQIRAISG